MMTAGIVLALVGLFGLASINYAAKHRKLPEKRLQLDQSDPIVLAAVRETDAEFPMLPPLLDPKIRRADELKFAELATEETRRAALTAQREEEARLAVLVTTATERAFFAREHDVPARADVAYRRGNEFVMKDGRKVHQAAVALYGWDEALARMNKMNNKES